MESFIPHKIEGSFESEMLGDVKAVAATKALFKVGYGYKKTGVIATKLGNKKRMEFIIQNQI